MIEILTTGGVNSVQDPGRFGYLDAGVGRAGAMDGPALELANRMIGNDASCAGIEVALFPFRLRVHASITMAVTGADAPLRLNGRQLPIWWAVQAASGDVVEIGIPRAGARVYLAFSGGIDVPEVLGSRATDLKSRWGGLDGRGLRRGDQLKIMGGAALPAALTAGFGLDPTELGRTVSAQDATRLRVLPSAEHSLFTSESLSDFYGSDWLVTDEANRQGYRLAGAQLAPARKVELFSHGIMPGTVQVPPSGQPIIQLAEANTCGGYPKIANVIEADLWKLAQAASGARLRFVAVDRAEAISAWAQQGASLDRLATFATLARKGTNPLTSLAATMPRSETSSGVNS